jgi:uncharacterized repeat protein (TIGR04138 family)
MVVVAFRRAVGRAGHHRETCVGTLALRDGLMDSILQRDTRFDERAYAFVLAALEYLQSRLPERRHVDGRELAHAVRELALEQFGVLSGLVLRHWGIRSTADLGDIVFALVETGLLMSQSSDRRLDFVDVYDFDEAFEEGYPWSAGHLV